jgi:cardiolipin synthase
MRALDDAGLARYYREQAGVRPVTAGRPEFFDTGPEIRRKMLDLIRGAKSYILIDSFLLTRTASSAAVLEALKEKRAQGLRIYVLADASSRFVPGKPVFAELDRAGIPCAEFHPIHPGSLFKIGELFERDHRKFWVVDGKILFIGGANLHGESLDGPGGGGNLDFMVAIESPGATREMVDAFAEAWNKSSKRKLDASEFAVSRSCEPHADVWMFDQRLQSGREKVPVMVDGLFDVARRDIWLLQPYTFTHDDLLRKIREASGRGVRVNLILSRKAKDVRFIFASYYGVRDILDAGGHVWICNSKISPLHYKGILVDDRWVSVGSANLNFRSYHLSREASVVFRDPLAVRAMRDTLRGVLRDSREVTMKEARHYRGPLYWLWWKVMQLAG